MRRYWVIRMGEGGRYVEEARKHGYVAIGWKALGDLSWLNNEGVTQDHLKKHYKDNVSILSHKA